MALLSVDEAKEKGINACVDKIGRDFCRAHNDNSVSVWGDRDEYVYCFVGVNPEPGPECDINKVDTLELVDGNNWTYYAICNVFVEDGHIEYRDCNIPQTI